MATVAVASPEIGALDLEHIRINPQQQPQTDLTQLQAARTVTLDGPCIQYEDVPEDMENVFQVIFVNANAQTEYSGSAIEQEVVLQGDIDHSAELSPQEQANGADYRKKIGEPPKLEAEIGRENETMDMLGWFQSTFSEIERNGIITLKDFKAKARHSDVSYIYVSWSKPTNQCIQYGQSE